MPTNNYVSSGMGYPTQTIPDYYRSDPITATNMRDELRTAAKRTNEQQATLQDLAIRKQTGELKEWEQEAPLRQSKRELEMERTQRSKKMEAEQYKTVMGDLIFNNTQEMTDQRHQGLFLEAEGANAMRSLQNEQLRLETKVNTTAPLVDLLAQREQLHRAGRGDEFDDSMLVQQFEDAMDRLERMAVTDREKKRVMQMREDPGQTLKQLQMTIPGMKQQLGSMKEKLAAAATHQYNMQLEAFKAANARALEKIKASADTNKPPTSMEGLAARIGEDIRKGTATRQDKELYFGIRLTKLMEDNYEQISNDYFGGGMENLQTEWQKRLDNKYGKGKRIAPVPSMFEYATDRLSKSIKNELDGSATRNLGGAAKGGNNTDPMKFSNGRTGRYVYDADGNIKGVEWLD